MPDIPDKVIEQAREAGWAAYGAARVVERASELDRVYARASSAVIAAWARQQERNRIKAAIDARRLVPSKHDKPPDFIRTRQAGFNQGLDAALAVLGRDGSADTREGEQ